MSSYLNFYLVPKKKEEQAESPTPLLFASYSRNDDIYQAFSDNLSLAYRGDDEERQYTELTKENALYVVEDIRKDLEKAKAGLDSRLDAYRQLPQLNQESIDTYIDDYSSTKEYIKELEDTIKELQFLANTVSDITDGYTDFEKVLINID